jgi:hypothetical protein
VVNSRYNFPLPQSLLALFKRDYPSLINLTITLNADHEKLPTRRLRNLPPKLQIFELHLEHWCNWNNFNIAVLPRTLHTLILPQTSLSFAARPLLPPRLTLLTIGQYCLGDIDTPVVRLPSSLKKLTLKSLKIPKKLRFRPFDALCDWLGLPPELEWLSLQTFMLNDANIAALPRTLKYLRSKFSPCISTNHEQLTGRAFANLPRSLETLILLYCPHLPKLTEEVFGQLPPRLKEMDIDLIHKFTLMKLNRLPQSIEILTLNCRNWDQPSSLNSDIISHLPICLRDLRLRFYEDLVFPEDLALLPCTLTSLEIGGRFHLLGRCIRRIPPSVTKLNVLVMNSCNYKVPSNVWSFLPPGLTSLTMNAASKTHCFGFLPISLTHLDLYLEREHFNQSPSPFGNLLALTNLQTLSLRSNSPKQIEPLGELPNTITSLYLDRIHPSNLTMPSRLESLTLFYMDRVSLAFIAALPKSLRHLTLPHKLTAAERQVLPPYLRRVSK